VIFAAAPLAGAYVIDIEKREDARGFFARTWCAREFAAQGLATRFVQANVSRSLAAGTLRGMHYQVAPRAEVKLVRCTRGAVHDVILDLRPDSPTFRRWLGVELSAESHRMLYVPAGCAHGFLSLEDGSEVAYQVSAPYTPECERGIRFDDPAFGIAWPRPVRVISEKDRSWPDYARAAAGAAELAARAPRPRGAPPAPAAEEGP